LAKAGRLQTDAIAAGTAAATDTLDIFANALRTARLI
jgi:hypothetical protein